MTMNAEFPMLSTHISTPSRRSGLGNSSRSRLFSTPRSHRTPTRFTSSGSVVVPRMSPSPRVARKPVSTTKLTTSSGLGDRFIPSRRYMNVDMCRRSLFSEEKTDEETRDDTPEVSDQRKLFKKSLLSSLCDYPIESLDDNAKPKSLFRSRNNDELRFCAQKTRVRLEDPYSQNILGGGFSLSSGENELSKRKHSSRKVFSKKPFKILDAPGIVDDYYMDHLSWSGNNKLAVSINNVVYSYDIPTKEVSELANYNGIENMMVYSVSWSANSRYLAVGTNSSVEIMDATSGQKLRNLHGHEGVVSSLSWNHHCLTTGGGDSRILHHDVRCHRSVVSRCVAHEQKIAKLQWNEDGSMLASGGDDDLLCIWDLRMSSGRSHAVEPQLKLREHKAAVKAIDWSPHRRGVIASGGGSKDKTIKIWNSQNGALLSSTDSGSQVSSVIWSPHRNELCSSHGYSSNVLTLWKQGLGSSGLTKMTDFTGHSSRVLGAVCSPDGSQVASVGSDETICFWDVFGEPSRQRSSSSISSVWGEASLGVPVIR